MRTPLVALAPLVLLVGACSSGTPKASSGGSTSTGTGGGQGGGGGVDVSTYLSAPTSCAYDCPGNNLCDEATMPYACPALGDWKAIPHLDTCGAWDGSYPSPTPGTCIATAPTGAALKRTGPDAANPGARILPDGRILAPAGSEWAFNEADVVGGNTSSLTAVPGTPYVLTLDTGNNDHVVRAVDTSKIGKGNPVTGYVKFSPPSNLNGSIAFVSPGRVYVGTSYGVVQALSFDVKTGALTREDAASPALPPNADGGSWYTSSVAASPDGKRLVVTAVKETQVLVYDIDPASPSYLKQLGALDIGAQETFGVSFDPNDATGTRAYVTLWGGHEVLELDLSVATKPKVARSFTTDRNPEGLVFLDGRWIAVANDYGETISLLDRVAGTVTAVAVDFEPGMKGVDVSGLAWDKASSRLYAMLAGVNAIAAYDVDMATTPPTLQPVGRLPTSWWPSGITVQGDGSITLTNLRGHPIGPLQQMSVIGSGGGDEKMRGSVEQIPAPTLADLTAGDKQVHTDVEVGSRPGYPVVECPSPARDFPVPASNTEGASKVIKHVIFIVRENKAFDALLGDLPTVEGDPTLTMKVKTSDMDRVWTNFRDLARTFTVGDNFYNLAVKSTQGHQWMTYGRATDFCERTWSANARQVPVCGISPAGRPDEGSLFDWLGQNHVEYDILGEIVGGPAVIQKDHPASDVHYPGGPFQNITYNDLEKACYTSARARVACDLGSFVYMTLPNDHTVGASPTNATPETMCAVNDEATGMIVDAISHSPLWASSLIIINEDDPQQGGDHIDFHRAPLVVVSPWVKRGYTTKTHIDVASLHKLFAHIFGLPYPHLIAKDAGLPLDMFTSTPDYTPYTFKHRVWPLECGKEATKSEQRLTGSWDFSEVDAQPGLGGQVMRWMRGEQLTELTPEMEAGIARRNAMKAAGVKAAADADEDE